MPAYCSSTFPGSAILVKAMIFGSNVEAPRAVAFALHRYRVIRSMPYTVFVVWLLNVTVSIPVNAETRFAEAAVRKFYKHVVARHPLGIPRGSDRELLWPLMTRRLVRILQTAAACEDDYFRRNTCSSCKPQFSWLEFGLFSGGNEEALPAEIEIVDSESIAPKSFRITVKFTYRETFATYGRPPNPENHFEWLGQVIVDCSKKSCLIDDFSRKDYDFTLSTSFIGCDGSRWVGIAEKSPE